MGAQLERKRELMGNIMQRLRAKLEDIVFQGCARTRNCSSLWCYSGLPIYWNHLRRALSRLRTRGQGDLRIF